MHFFVAIEVVVLRLMDPVDNGSSSCMSSVLKEICYDTRVMIF